MQHYFFVNSNFSQNACKIRKTVVENIKKHWILDKRINDKIKMLWKKQQALFKNIKNKNYTRKIIYFPAFCRKYKIDIGSCECLSKELCNHDHRSNKKGPPPH